MKVYSHLVFGLCFSIVLLLEQYRKYPNHMFVVLSLRYFFVCIGELGDYNTHHNCWRHLLLCHCTNATLCCSWYLTVNYSNTPNLPLIQYLQQVVQVVKEDQEYPNNYRISNIVYLFCRTVDTIKQVFAAWSSDGDAFQLYQIRSKTSQGYEGNWMNRVGVRTYVLESKQNIMEKNLIFINDFLYCCDLACKEKGKMKQFVMLEEQEQSLVDYIDGFLTH